MIGGIEIISRVSGMEEKNGEGISGRGVQGRSRQVLTQSRLSFLPSVLFDILQSTLIRCTATRLGKTYPRERKDQKEYEKFKNHKTSFTQPQKYKVN